MFFRSTRIWNHHIKDFADLFSPVRSVSTSMSSKMFDWTLTPYITADILDQIHATWCSMPLFPPQRIFSLITHIRAYQNNLKFTQAWLKEIGLLSSKYINWTTFSDLYEKSLGKKNLFWPKCMWSQNTVCKTLFHCPFLYNACEAGWVQGDSNTAPLQSLNDSCLLSLKQ